MGASQSQQTRPNHFDQTIAQHVYSSHQPHLPVLSPAISGYFLDHAPNFEPPYFRCLGCSRELYDGNLCQILTCSCGTTQIRRQNNQVQEKQHPVFSFQDQFQQFNSKIYADYIELKSISIGIFQDSIPDTFVSENILNFSGLFLKYLNPFFVQKMRCLNQGDLFKVQDCEFKVLSVYPTQGFLTKHTRIHFYTSLCTRSIRSMILSPVQPYVINQDIFGSLIIPYFQENFRHLHQEETLCINGLTLIVVRAEPDNGLVQTDTSIQYHSSPAVPIQNISVSPFIEDLPEEIQSLSSQQMVKTIVDRYIMPFLKGWNRMFFLGKIFKIAGVPFKVTMISPGAGIITDFTKITYKGQFQTRGHYFPIRRIRNTPHYRSIQNRLQILQSNQQLLRQLVEMMESVRIMRTHTNQNSLTTFVLEKLPLNEEQTSCLICQNLFEVNQVVQAFPCLHLFHEGCIEQWLPQSNLCPTCKTASNQSFK